MRSILKILLSVFLIVALLPVAALAEDGNEADENESEEAEVAEEAEGPIYVLDYFDGTALDVSQYEGKVLFLNFFTEWCPYCMEEMPDIKAIFDAYDPNSLAIVLIHPWDGENADNTASVVAKYGLEGVYTVEDEDFTLTGIVGVPGYPTSVFIDANGYLNYAVASKLDYDTIAGVLNGMGVPLRDGTVLPAASPAGSAPSNIAQTNAAPDATTGATPKN